MHTFFSHICAQYLLMRNIASKYLQKRIWYENTWHRTNPGLVGSKFVEIYKEVHEFQNLDPDEWRWYFKRIQQVDDAFQNQRFPLSFILQHIPIHKKRLNKTGDKEGPAYKVNVIGTRNIARAAKKTGKYLVHISTAYVFDGKKQGKYVEDDPVNPIEWYGQTKAWAEEEVAKNCERFSILRIDRPYRLDEFPKRRYLA